MLALNPLQTVVFTALRKWDGDKFRYFEIMVELFQGVTCDV